MRRSTTPPCNITSVNGVMNPALFSYLTTAANAGTKIVLRINPSPGDFEDTFGVTGSHHVLMTGAGDRPQQQVGPGNIVTPDYCGNITYQGTNKPAQAWFRSVDDIANEMIDIRNYTSIYGWKPYAFEPANEPNSAYEWYPNQFDVQTSSAWNNMDAYFAGIYSQVHSVSGYSDVPVFAPPMAQLDYAEAFNTVDCSQYLPNWPGGLDYMSSTWVGSSSDGWSWHNYWTYGQEAATPDNSCTPGHEHNFEKFPSDIKTLILSRSKPALISEADLFSPCGGGDAGLLTTKGGFGIDQNSSNAANAIKVFISQEQGANYVAIWNLTIYYSDLDTCPSGAQGTNDEFAWHEAYRNSAPYERNWFYQWWMDTTQP